MLNKKHITAFDIGSSSVKMMEFLKTSRGVKLLSVHIEEMAPVPNEAGRLEELREALKKLVRRVRIKGASVAVSINSEESALSSLSVPRPR